MDDLVKIDNLIVEMKSQLVDKIEHFQYSRTTEIPFQVHSFIEVMSYRMVDFSESAQTLLKNNQIVPAVALIRSLFENTAITSRIVKAVDESLKKGELTDDFDDLTAKINFGTRYDNKIQSINVLTLIDKLDRQFKGLRKFYDSLCEFTHPNWDGVKGSYSELDEHNNCIYLQKILNSEHPTTKYFQNCFLLALSIFTSYAKWLRSNLKDFAILCESEITKK